MIKDILKNTFLKKELDSYIDGRIDSKLQNLKFLTKKMEWKEALDNELEFLLKPIYRNLLIKCYLDSKLCEFIFLDIFEKKVTNFLKKVLKQGDVFVDVGANIGVHSILASSLVGNNGKVIAFEPSQKAFSRLRENIQLNSIDNIDSYQLGISNKKKVESLIKSMDGYDAWNSIVGPSEGQQFEKEVINTDTLDNLALQLEPLQDSKLVKIDVEGWELMVLKGGINFFENEKAPIVVIEFTEDNALNAGSTTEVLYNQLTQLGYKMFKLSQDGSKLINEPYNGPYGYDNLVALKENQKYLDGLISIEYPNDKL